MAQYLVFRFDVTKLTARQRALLEMHVVAQAEASDYDGVLYDENDAPTGDPNYPDVEVAELCPWCHAERVDGECGGEGEGTCTESDLVVSYLPSFGTPEQFVRTYCEQERIENAPVPYRNDGLTYYDQLAFLVREYHGLDQPKKASRRLP